jgi:hypothetical protein
VFHLSLNTEHVKLYTDILISTRFLQEVMKIVSFTGIYAQQCTNL